MTFGRARAEASAYHYLDSFWQSRFGDFDAAVEDLAADFEAAITDRWVEWKERTNGLRSNRAALAGDGASDSDLNRSRSDAQQDVGGRRVGAREFSYADVAEMAQEMEQAREGRDA